MTRNHWYPEKPYNEIPLLPPVDDLESRVVLKQCIEARSALAELNQAAELIPNQGMLINTLPILEAQASSEIENIVTTTDSLFRHFQGEGRVDPATKEALRYRHALMNGFEDLSRRPLSTSTAELVCSELKGTGMTVRRVPGTTLANEASGEIIYTPPVGESLLRDLLANWERFMHEATDMDPLVRLAVGHYQFEAIHPFTDGNGRTGRVLNSLFLIQEGLLSLPILYLSRFIISNRSDYYRLLIAVTSRREWEPWVLYMLRAVEETSAWTTAKIKGINTLSENTVAYVKRCLPKIYSRELIDVIFTQPYCRVARLVEAGIAKRQTASLYLRQLAEIGVLRESPSGREKLFIHDKLLLLLASEGNDVEAYPI